MTGTPEPDPGVNAVTDRFHQVATEILDALLADDPEWASSLGDHRFSDRLADHSDAAQSNRAATLTDALGALDEIDDTLLPPAERVDLEMLRAKITGDLWRLTELRPQSWNPLTQLPNRALYQLIVRADQPVADRLRALVGRCRSVPGFLTTARAALDAGTGMPRVHVETALARGGGTLHLLGSGVDALLAEDSVPSTLRREADTAREEARAALHHHLAWLEERLDAAAADPRLGERDYAAQLWYTLDCELSPETLLTRAESDLIAAEEEIAEVAAEYAGRPRYQGQTREVLDEIAVAARTDADTILPLCRRSLEHLARRTTELDLVTVPNDPVRVISMPESERGVALAYCDAPGPLAGRDRGTTLIAVAPPPADWPAERVASFYREYNAHMVRDLMVHEGIPGHALQTAHEARYRSATPVRAALRNGTFVEGWAVYAEELVATAGWDSGVDLALRLSQLKMRLRVLLNAILDIRTHTHDIDGAGAMTLLTGRGYQEEGEAAAKWRRARLTSAQMPTYYVGYREISDLVRDLAIARPGVGRRELHDTVLAHGSPPPRHLRYVLGLDQG